MLARLYRRLRSFALGRDLRRALDRHRQAAEGLDAAVKEMLRQ